MFQIGSIVIYKNSCAIVTDVSSDKFVIQFQSNNAKKNSFDSQKIREKDAFLLHRSGAKNLNEILECSENNAIKEKFITALKESHELLTSDDETKNEKICLKDLAELSVGQFNANESYAFYKAVLESNFFALTYSEETNTDCTIFFIPRDLDEIKKIKEKEVEKEKEVLVRQEFIKRLKQKKLQLPEDAKYMQEVEALVLGKTDKSKVLKEAGFSEKIEKAHKLLIDTGIWSYTKNPYPVRFDLSTQSATETLSSPPEDEERLEVDHIAYAIDNQFSNDPDDAIAFDGTYLWIHIADPASTVTPDSKIDIAARNRGATLYIPEGVARMLAEDCLADYALGLSEPAKKSKALSFRIKLSENGTIEDINIFKTKVHVILLSYSEADEKKDSPELLPLFQIASRNIEKRKNAGAVFIEMPEVNIKVDNEKNVTITENQRTESSIVVRESMLLAGEAAARFAFKNELPFPYVSQDAPDLPKDVPNGLAGQYKLRRSMRSRSVSITPSSHMGLGLGMYSQVTSPLRRYSDLVAHQQLRAFIDGRTPLDKDAMLERIAAGDAASSNVTKADRASSLHWTLVYLTQNPEWTGDAICVELRGKQATFIIPSLAHETVIATNGKISLNDSVTVRAANINIPELKVDFIIQ
ncbi:MAG: RNB domain-containing ribonuclease [Treponema sp.]|nr:RNB domain-containing ribonuclease [Treponema sp.]